MNWMVKWNLKKKKKIQELIETKSNLDGFIVVIFLRRLSRPQTRRARFRIHQPLAIPWRIPRSRAHDDHVRRTRRLFVFAVNRLVLFWRSRARTQNLRLAVCVRWAWGKRGGDDDDVSSGCGLMLFFHFSDNANRAVLPCSRERERTSDCRPDEPEEYSSWPIRIARRPCHGPDGFGTVFETSRRV